MIREFKYRTDEQHMKRDAEHYARKLREVGCKVVTFCGLIDYTAEYPFWVIIYVEWNDGTKDDMSN